MAPSTRTKAKGKAPAKKQATKRAKPLPRVPGDKPQPQHILDQEQSFEQMKIVSIAVISRIAVARDLFPKLSRKYHLRTYDPANPDPSYKAFIEGKGNSDTGFKPTDNIGVWKLIPRGLDEAADKLLGWVEQGIQAAIELRYLKRFELTIHSVDGGPIRYANMLESYTVSFTYGSDQQMTISTLNGYNKISDSELLCSAKNKLYNLVQAMGDKFRIEGGAFPPLPGRCRLGMALLFNDRCPRGYQPPLFRAGDTETFKMLRAAHSDNELSMDTRFHGVSVGWALAALSSEDFSSSTQVAVNRRSTWSLSRRQPSYNVGDTQEGNMEILRHVKFSRRFSDLSHDTRPLRSSSALSSSSVQPSPPVSQRLDGLPLVYSQSINVLIQKARGRARSQDEHELQCECDSLDTEGELIKCEICTKYQHYPCYGYLGGRPSTHVCYRCLSEHSPGGFNWIQIQNLCITRRTLYYIHIHGPSILNEELGAFLGCDESNADRILTALGEDNLVKLAPNSRKGKHRWGERKFSIEGVDFSSIFDPAKDIQHLLAFTTGLTPGNKTQGFSLPEPPLAESSSSSPLRERKYLSRPGGDSSSMIDHEIVSPTDISSDTYLGNTVLRPTLYNHYTALDQQKHLGSKRKAETTTEKSNDKKPKIPHMGTSTSPATLNRD